MTTNKKDLCPVCKENMKGINSKTCVACRVEILKVKHTTSKPKAVRVGETTSDGKYYL